MGYPVDNARLEWEEGEDRVRATAGAERKRLESAADLVVNELRRRLGSAFSLAELAELYRSGVDWASDLAAARVPVGQASWSVDAAFHRYAREASDWGGPPR